MKKPQTRTLATNPRIPPATRHKVVSGTIAGTDLEDLEYVHGKYYSGAKLGMALAACIRLAATYLRERERNQNEDQKPNEIQNQTTEKPNPEQNPKPQTKMDWSKGDPLPEQFVAPENSGSKTDLQTIAPKRSPQVQALIDEISRPMSTQRPKPLPSKSFIQNSSPKPLDLTPANERMARRIYFLDNYYQDKGTEGDRNASTAWLNTLKEGHSIRVTSNALDIIEAHLHKMLRDPELDKWMVKNPRWPEFDPYIWEKDGQMKKFDL